MDAINRRDIPQLPGIYFFLDSHKKPLYIGKAANLRNRLGSYFVGTKDPRITRMLETADTVGWQTVGSEIEALILESQRIKRHTPPFNILLRDDKQYFYVAFSNESFPKVSLTHQPTLSNKAKTYIGPFTSGTALKSTLKLLRKAMPFCTCKSEHTRLCLNAHLGNCLGFCCLKTKTAVTNAEKATYKKTITGLKSILNGKRGSFEKQQLKSMMLSANAGRFDSAIQIRTKLEKLKQIFDNAQVIRAMDDKYDALRSLQSVLELKAIPERIEGYDISHNQGTHATGSLVVFIKGIADKSLYRKFKIKSKATPDDTAMLREILTRRLRHAEWPLPDLILIDGGKAQFNVVSRVIAEHDLTIPIISLTKNDHHVGTHIFSSHDHADSHRELRSLPRSMSNLILEIDGEAHRFAISYYRKLHRKIA